MNRTVARSKINDSNQADPPGAIAVDQRLRRFEGALSEVEAIVSHLESGQLELAESLDQYQKGIETLKECHQLLAAAERRITLLSGFDADGNPVTSDFDQAEMSLSEKQSRRGSRRGVSKVESAPLAAGDPPEAPPGLF